MIWVFVTIILCGHVFTGSNADTDYQTDLEIFDLFEEIPGTFYELLGVQQDASQTEIRRAYRKLSLQLHPDKNKAEDAEDQFRKLVAVYDILKDKEKREKYNDVLVNGLPDWRQPIYYYRKYRKMGTLELSIIISVIATIGHFLTWIVAFYEKKFEMEEVLAPLRKRRDKKRAKGKLNETEEDDDLETERYLERELGYRRPTFWDLLPFVICRGTFNFFRNIPKRIREHKKRRQKELERIKREEEEEREREAFIAEKQARPKKVKQPTVLRDAAEFESETRFVLDNQGERVEEDVQKKMKDKEWDGDDYAALAKAMAKFPGGTPGRWERIAHELGRRSDEVTKKVKEMKTALAANVVSPTGGSDQVIIKKKQAVNLSDAIVTKSIDYELNKTSIITDSDLYQTQYDIPDDYDEGFDQSQEQEEDYVIVPKKVKKKTRPEEEEPKNTEENANDEDDKDKDNSEKLTNKKVENDVWSQVQQKCLEAAILQFPKSTSDRWTCIARAVPDKNKEQCITRYKLLAEHVKQKRQAKSS